MSEASIGGGVQPSVARERDRITRATTLLSVWAVFNPLWVELGL